ncbi:uncharacterized protein K02A2.6-like [Lutzomyia longipalpis]|uniref:uncharacterized protein K02A2.6-like n=1 Tax=Lutzomyia longipalpis TaxID=7200 RepID=UPI0024833284|nr:uncharacterized protein K02A2.6-like [Lutzomyia longipalpis]
MENQEQNQVQAAQAAPDVPARVLVAPPKPLELERNMKAAWKSWISSYEWYAKANRVNRQDADIQAAIFMSTIGKNVLEIFEGFGLTEEEKEDVNIIKARFQQYFIPRANDIYEGFALRQIMQGEDEKFHEFVTRLTVQAKKANYQALTDRMILEQLVIGVRWEKMKEKLLSTPDITLNQAIDFCLAYELALAQKEAIIKSEKVDKSEVKVDAIQKEAPKEKSGKEYDCQRCGRKHAFRRCPAFGKECRKCGEKGHFANCCKKEAVKVQEVKVEDHDDELETFKICEVSSRDRKSAWIHTLKCRGESFAVKIDTGADCCVINAKVLGTLKVDTIEASKVKKLITYNGSEIPVLGQIVLPCYFGSEEVPLTFQVIKTQCMPVIDGEAAIKAGLIKRLLEVKFPEEVFEGLGCVKNFTYEIDLIDNPKFTVHPARVIPYPVRDAVKKELDKMEQLGVIKKCVKATDSVSPLVVVRRNGKIRLCVDFTDLNKNIKRRHFPLSTIEEISTRLSRSTRFTILDCTRGFWQVQIAEKSQDLLTFATPWGRFSCKRLPFGLASAPEVFQLMMCQLFRGVDGVEVSMDDILIHAKDESALAEKTEQVMKIILESGLKLNREKCVFDQPEVKFLGHIVCKEGLKVDPAKVEAINQLKEPEDVKALQRLLGVTKEMSDLVETCRVCQANQRMHTKETLLMKEVPELPFEIVSSDLFSFQGDDFILLADSYSGYYDFAKLRNTTSESVIVYLKDKFAEHGVPRELHTDGGPQYSSKEFREFAKQWGFDHKISSPYFPRSNGLAERYVQSAKNLLKKCRMDKQDIRLALLLDRNSPKETLRSPAERLLGRKTRNPLIVSSNSLKPILVNDNSSQLQILRDKQKQYADRGAKEYSQMPIGTRVRLKDQDGRWLAGEIADKATDRSYVVKLEDGRAVRRNRRFIAPTKVQGNFSHGSSVDVDVPDVQTPAENDDLGEQGEENREDPMPVVPVEENVLAPSPSVRTRSGRLVVPPQRLNL